MKKRKRLWVWLIVLAVIAAAGFGLWKWQENNIRALLQFSQNSKEDLEQQLQQNDQQVQDILNDALANADRVDPQPQPDHEDTGTVVPDDPAELPEVIEPLPDPEPDSNPAAEPEQDTEPAPTPQPSAPPAPKQPTYKEQLQDIVDRVYALRTEYVTALETLEAEASAAYKAMPASEKTKKNLIDFASTYISKATNLEKECDAKMDVLVKDLEALQKKYGQSYELVEQMIYTYANEKSLKKAWYMAELESRGMI